ncbi:MAG TPA: hypothetical protein VMU04_18000 [Candidatus Acidoferrum sp.]|nr:hypothetical protein [Candidatus Acidoferrum sp.]
MAAWGGRWLSKLAALFSRPSSTPGKLKLPGSLRGQVQGELALDRIKVVRNDLSDADLEVVPARLPISRVAIKPAWSGTDSRASASRGRRAGLARTDKS